MKHLFNLKSYFTFLSRNKVYTAINVFGLSVSFAFVILIGLYYLHETGIDHHVPDGDRVYGLCVDVKGERISGSSRELIPVLQKRLPQVESGCAVYLDTEVRLSVDQTSTVKVSMLYADSTFDTMFHRPLIEGNARSGLATLNDVLISKRLAQQLFPQGHALDQTLTMGRHTRLRVKGVYDNMDDTSLPDADLIGRYELLRPKMPFFFKLDGNFGSPDVFLKLRKGTDVASLEKSVNRMLQPFYNDAFKMKVTFSLTPFSKSYFSTYDSSVCKRGKRPLLFLIFIIGVVILLFSIMNYINLTTAQAGYRSHEMATRRLLGSQKWEVRLRLVVESVCLCLCSVIVAALLAWVFIPSANHLLDTRIAVSGLFEWLPLTILLGVVLTVGVLAGLLPAFILSRVKPIDVVRGTFRRQTKMVFSKVFIVVQNVITITCIAVAVIFSLQVRHLINAPLGYEPKGVMQLMVAQDARPAELFKKTLLRLPCVQAASVCLCSPLDGGFNQMAYVKGQAVRCQRFYGDEDYLRLLGIKVHNWTAQGDSIQIYVAPNFHTVMGLKKDARLFRYNESYDPERISGVVDDFHLRTINHESDGETSVVYLFKKMPNEVTSSVLVKVQGDENEAFRQVQEAYRKVYHEDMNEDHPFLVQRIAEVYKEQARIAKLMVIFSFVAVLISLLGLIAMSTYFIQQRSREIAIRKVFGSTSNQIRRDLIRTFLNYVGIAFVVSVPVIWYLTGQWISQYNYRIVWWPWIVVAGVVVLLFSFGAVAVQSWVASNENPVRNIKQE